MTPKEEDFMRQAIRLAADNIENGGGPFGAVIVKDGRVIATGVNRVTANHDPTAHAEVQAIRAAGLELGTFDLTGCDLYSSCEPCPMCLSAIYWAHISRLFYASGKEDAAAAGFDDAFIYRELALQPSSRRLTAEAHPSADAAAVFERWVAKADKIDY